MQNNEFTMRMPDDFHLHLRNGAMLRAVLPHSARQFKRGLIMPNTVPAILCAWDMQKYEEEIAEAVGDSGFKTLMAIQITESTTPEMVVEAKEVGAIAGKVYPHGMTHNSENGVKNYDALFPPLGAMQECGMLALFHGESPERGVFCLDREAAFLRILTRTASSFPRLKMVMEHVTTAEAVNHVRGLGNNVAATITVHHLCLTLDDVLGDKLEPHHFCKPVAKRQEDREALLRAATSGDPQCFLGTDSAPHLKGAKECASGCAGIFTAPVAIPLLFEIFEERDAVEKLEDFCSGFGADFYGIPRNKETITLVREPWTVPEICDGVVPFRAGKEMAWKVK